MHVAHDDQSISVNNLCVIFALALLGFAGEPNYFLFTNVALASWAKVLSLKAAFGIDQHEDD